MSPWFFAFIGLFRADVEAPKVLDDRLTIELFASDPEIVTPTGIAVDSRGRVLVIECHTHFRPEGYVGPPADRIRAFEDTTGDGRADRISTFHEGTSATMNLAVYRDGSVFVATRNEVFRLFDDDNDGKAERRRDLVRLETEGNYPHNGLSGFAFDFAGRAYFGFGENLGASYKLIGSDGTTLAGGGEGGNIYRCDPDGRGLIQVATGFWNPFHLCFDAHDRLFAVDNDPDSRPPCRLLHIVPGGDYGYRFRNGRKGLHPFTAWNGELPGTLPMVAGTGEAPSGVIAYESDGLPAEYRGDLLVTSWGDHRIERYRLEQRGASFRAVAEPIVVGGEQFRPVGIAVAPDGSLFVSDWVDKSYPLHGKGRIWRLRAKDAPERRQYHEPTVALAQADRAIRDRAARALVEMGREGRKLLETTLKRSDDERVRSTALVALATAGDLSESAAQAALTDRSANVRARAVELLSAEQFGSAALAVNDRSDLVRAAALRRLEDPNVRQALLRGLESDDPFVRQAARLGMKASLSTDDLLTSARDRKAPRRLGALLLLREASDPKALDAVGRLLDDPDPRVRFAAVQWVAEAGLDKYRQALEAGLARGSMTRELFGAYLAAFERLDGVRRASKDESGGEDYVARMLLDPTLPVSARRRALRALRPDHPELTIERLKNWLDEDDPGLRLEVVRTLRQQAEPARLEPLARLARDATESKAIRTEAMAGLSIDVAEHRDLLLRLAESEDPMLRREALRALNGIDAIDGGSTALATVVDVEGPDAEAARRSLDPKTRFERPKNTDSAAWSRLLDGPGDPRSGERTFFHPKGPGCYLCHRIDGRGSDVGPDLSAIARMPGADRLLESMLEPSKEIAPQFVPWIVATSDGTVRTGVLVEERLDGKQVYADAQGKRFTVAPADLESRRQQQTSIMPEDLALRMTTRELRDLLAFLRKPR